VNGELNGDRTPNIREGPRANEGCGRGVGADDTRRAGRAVLRGLEIAEKIVVLERCRSQEDGVERHPHERQPSPARSVRVCRHFPFDDTPAATATQLPCQQEVTGVSAVLPSQDHSEATRDAAQVALAGVLGDPVVAKNARNVCVLRVDAQSEEPTGAELDTGDAEGTSVARAEGVPVRAFLVEVPAAADAHVRDHAG